jgi:hypothetical protein
MTMKMKFLLGGVDEMELSFCVKEDTMLMVCFSFQYGYFIRASRDGPRAKVFTRFDPIDFMDFFSPSLC